MKILFIAPSLPINNGAGHAIRSYQLYTELTAFANVDVVTANSVGVSFPLIREFKKNHNYLQHIDIDWEDYFFGNSYPLSSSLNKILSNEKYDYVFIRYYNTAYRLGALKIKNLILDCDDCYLELLAQQDRHKTSGKIKKLTTTISDEFRRFNYTKNIRSIERVIFSKESSQIEFLNNFTLISNKISLVATQHTVPSNSKDCSGATVLFVGVLNYEPNYEGLFHFVTQIWPLVIFACPHAKLKIVGTGLPPEYYREWSKCPHIEICGFVPDIEDVYADVDLAIAPVYKGSGTHIKVMESLIRSKTMVISPLAHRGYENSLRNEQCLFVADSVDIFAERLIQLISDKTLREKMGADGRNAVITHHTIEANSRLLERVFTRTSENDGSRQPLESPKSAYENAYE